MKDFNKNSYVKSLEPNLKHIKSTDRSDDLHSNDSRFNIWTINLVPEKVIILVPEKVLPGGVKIPPGSGTKVINPPGSTFSGSKITGTKIAGAPRGSGTRVIYSPGEHFFWD